jgi:hypothetical protein
MVSNGALTRSSLRDTTALIEPDAKGSRGTASAQSGRNENYSGITVRQVARSLGVYGSFARRAVEVSLAPARAGRNPFFVFASN